MAFSTVWSSCVPLTIITVAYLVRTGKARHSHIVLECEVNEKNAKPLGCVGALLYPRAIFLQVF